MLAAFTAFDDTAVCAKTSILLAPLGAEGDMARGWRPSSGQVRCLVVALQGNVEFGSFLQ